MRAYKKYVKKKNTNGENEKKNKYVSINVKERPRRLVWTKRPRQQRAPSLHIAMYPGLVRLMNASLVHNNNNDNDM